MVSLGAFARIQGCNLHDQVRPVCSNTGDTNASLGCAVGSSHACFALVPTRLCWGAWGARTSKGHLFEVRCLVLEPERTVGTHCEEDAALQTVSL